MCVSVRLCCAREGVRWHSVCRPRNYVAWYTLPAFRLPSEFRERRLSESTSVVAPPARRPSRPSRRALRSDPRSCHVIESHKSRALDGGSACRDMSLQCLVALYNLFSCATCFLSFQSSLRLRHGPYGYASPRVGRRVGTRRDSSRTERNSSDDGSELPGTATFQSDSQSHVTSQTRDSDTPRHSLNSHQSRRRTEFLALGPARSGLGRAAAPALSAGAGLRVRRACGLRELPCGSLRLPRRCNHSL